MTWQAVEDLWPGRNEVIAKHIKPGSRVLDLGAGAQSLRAMLPDCDYTPADIVLRSTDAVLFDMNAGVWPVGRWDVVVMSGVLEYARDPLDALRHVRRLSRRALVSYVHKRNPHQPRVFANDVSKGAMRLLAFNAGFHKVGITDLWRTPTQKEHIIWRMS